MRAGRLVRALINAVMRRGLENWHWWEAQVEGGGPTSGVCWGRREMHRVRRGVLRVPSLKPLFSE